MHNLTRRFHNLVERYVQNAITSANLVLDDNHPIVVEWIDHHDDDPQYRNDKWLALWCARTESMGVNYVMDAINDESPIIRVYLTMERGYMEPEQIHITDITGEELDQFERLYPIIYPNEAA